MALNPFKLYAQISALLKIRTEVNKLMSDATTVVVVADGAKKPGWKTSEFWLSVAGIVVTIGTAASSFIPAAAFPWLASVAAIVPTVYAVARTIAKATPTTADDQFLDALAAKLTPLIKLDDAAK